jgi:hypothetical protein
LGKVKQAGGPRAKIFGLAFWHGGPLSLAVLGAFLNAIGILLGGLLGLALSRPLPLRAQLFFRSALAVSAFFFGLRLVWFNLSGTFLSGLKQVLLALVAVGLGFWLGKLLGLQKLSNRLGRRAAQAIAAAQAGVPVNTADGLGACVVLFCAAPLGLMGAVVDGLSGYFWLLAVKAVMDALAMVSFVKLFRWPAALAAFPVFAILGGIAFACQYDVAPWLATRHLVAPVNAAAGFICCAVTLVVLEVRRVELATFLPALIVAPVLAWWLG